MANISLNQKIIGFVDNMFTSYMFDVTELLQASGNALRVDFDSTVQVAAERQHQYPYIVPPATRAPAEQGYNLVQFVRTEQCSSGWDWGVAFADVGIWKGISLVTVPVGSAKVQSVSGIPTVASSENSLGIKPAPRLSALPVSYGDGSGAE